MDTLDNGSRQNGILSSRPYSIRSFERSLELFQDYIDFVTYKKSDDPPEVRRQKLIGEF
jgi:hypothetical protein